MNWKNCLLALCQVLVTAIFFFLGPIGVLESGEAYGILPSKILTVWTIRAIVVSVVLIALNLIAKQYANKWMQGFGSVLFFSLPLLLAYILTYSGVNLGFSIIQGIAQWGDVGWILPIVVLATSINGLFQNKRNKSDY